MKLDDLEDKSRHLKLFHLTEDELDSYHAQKLDVITQSRADTHLKHCLICKTRLTLIKEESEALNNQAITADDIALVSWLMQQMTIQEQLPDAKTADDIMKAHAAKGA